MKELFSMQTTFITPDSADESTETPPELSALSELRSTMSTPERKCTEEETPQNEYESSQVQEEEEGQVIEDALQDLFLSVNTDAQVAIHHTDEEGEEESEENLQIKVRWTRECVE